jgi:hypothetical protein
LVATVFLAWAVTLFNFVDRHWFAQPEPAELPLAPDDARIDVTRWQPIISAQKQFFMNIYLGDNGKSDALRWGFEGYGLAGPIPDKELADAFFIVLRTKVKASRTEQTIHVGQNDQFISIPNVPPFFQWDDNTIQNYKDGKLLVSIFLVMAYSDDKIPAAKTIYTEKCVYVVQDVVHNCSIHNRELIGN